MRLTADRDALLAAVRRAASATSPVSPRVVDRFVRVEAIAAGPSCPADSVRVTATDGVIGFDGILSADVQVGAAGVVHLDAKDLLARVTAMPCGRLDLGLTGKKGHVSIRHPQSARAFVMGSSSEKPNALPAADGRRVAITGTLLGRLLSRVAWAAEPGTADARSNAIELTVDSGKLGVAAAALTGRWMAAASTSQAKIEGHEGSELLIPGRAAKILATLARDAGDEEVVLAVSDGGLAASIGGVTLIFVAVAERFRAIPGVIANLVKGALPQELVVPRKALASAVSAVRLAIDEAGAAPGLALVLASGAVHLIGESNRGFARDSVPSATPAAAPTWGVYNPAAILDALGSLEEEDVSLSVLDNPARPLLVADETGGVASHALLGGISVPCPRAAEDLIAKAKAEGGGS